MNTEQTDAPRRWAPKDRPRRAEVNAAVDAAERAIRTLEEHKTQLIHGSYAGEDSEGGSKEHVIRLDARPRAVIFGHPSHYVSSVDGSSFNTFTLYPGVTCEGINAQNRRTTGRLLEDGFSVTGYANRSGSTYHYLAFV